MVTNMQILIIEDEILIQKSLKKLLEKKGVSVTAFSLGRKALESIFTHEYDLIICDLMLKDITGFDIIEESKKKYSKEEIEKKIVIITAYSSPQILDKAGKYGCKVITKPFQNLNQLINMFVQGNFNNEI